MSGRLRMYNVQFGDAFLLYGQGEHLLVDLGSIDSTVNFDRVRDSIRHSCGGAELSLLLTHFHRDHWSGLHNQTPGHRLPPLKRVYLPDIFRMRVMGRWDPVTKSLLSDFLRGVIALSGPDLLDQVTLSHTLRFTLADLLREVLPGLPMGQIRLLSRGSRFQAGGRRYETLWPQLDGIPLPERQSAAFRRFMERVEAKLSPGGGEPLLWTALERAANVLLRDFAHSLEGEDVYFPGFLRAEEGSYEEVSLRVWELAQALAEDVRRDEGEFRRKVRYYAEQLAQDWNRVSLVFQERLEEDCPGGGVLMTGDADKPALNRLAGGSLGAPRLHKYYDVIKAPHHGTQRHFCAKLPPSRYFCISNGDGNSGYKRISEHYEYVYGRLLTPSEFRCTNPRCEFCRSLSDCPYFSTRPVQDFYDVSW